MKAGTRNKVSSRAWARRIKSVNLLGMRYEFLLGN